MIDGTGAPARVADVTVDRGRITGVGSFADEAANRTVEADGLLVTPGWVDIHTHYDGQATWDEVLAPSSWHGVTTVVTGNCGVGFAPARPDRHDWLIGLMEGVEDIPGTALAEGMRWEWETLPRVPRRPRVGGSGPWTWAPRSPTARCAPTSWATAAPATRRPPPRTSPP